MKLIPILFSAFSLLAAGALRNPGAGISTAAGPVTITPLNHASTLIEAGGKSSIWIPPSP